MKAASLKQIKDELKHKDKEELLELCLKMSKFKKESKELLTYLLFEAHDETEYINEIKREVTLQFAQLNTASYYFATKGIRKILRNAKKFIRYSKQKQTEIDIILHFCEELKYISNRFNNNSTLESIYEKQVEAMRKKIGSLHEDLQYDYQLILENY